MATDPYWQLEKEYTTITASHDLTIKAIAYTDITRTENNTQITSSTPSKVHEFRVQRAILITASPVLAKLLTSNPDKPTIDLHGASPAALETWFRILHAPSPALEDTELAETLSKATLRDVWDVLAAAKKYAFNPKHAPAKAWFAQWYAAQLANPHERFGYPECQALLLPCYAFDYAPGFAWASKTLVYRANGFVAERQPEGFKDDDGLRMPLQVMQQLNAARARLHTLLHRHLYAPISGLLQHARCPCRPHVLLAYELALTDTEVWPLEAGGANRSVNDVLRLLESKFQGFRMQTCGDYWCSFDFKEVVAEAARKVRSGFDGLCLDCMALSNPAPAADTAASDDDAAYWRRATTSTWDTGCRVRHRQPSWYFSHMGPKAKMVAWTKGQGRGGGGRGRGENRGRRGGRGGDGGYGGAHGVRDGHAGDHGGHNGQSGYLAQGA